LSSWDIEPYDWFKRFFPSRRGGWGLGSFDDVFRGFEEIQREMDKELEDMKKNLPKDLVRDIKSIIESILCSPSNRLSRNLCKWTSAVP
jgi:hypothetical protein